MQLQHHLCTQPRERGLFHIRRRWIHPLKTERAGARTAMHGHDLWQQDKKLDQSWRIQAEASKTSYGPISTSSSALRALRRNENEYWTERQISSGKNPPHVKRDGGACIKISYWEIRPQLHLSVFRF